MTSTATESRVRWEELLPREFRARQHNLPLVYLPLGLCEPHGHVAAFGLDTIKADYLCEQAAHRFGGIVAPTQGYHVHESGYHRPWLASVVGDVNPHLGSVPPDVLLRMLMFQLRAFVNAGFRAVIGVTGHHANQPDLRLVAEEFMRDRPATVLVVSDPELAGPDYTGDHAGRYEISQLLHIRPDLVDLARVTDPAASPLGRFAQGPDAAQATAEYGRQILEHSLRRRGDLVAYCGPLASPIAPLSIEDTERIWRRVRDRQDEWCTVREDPPAIPPPWLGSAHSAIPPNRGVTDA